MDYGPQAPFEPQALGARRRYPLCTVRLFEVLYEACVTLMTALRAALVAALIWWALVTLGLVAASGFGAP